ncbi:MAG TPA: potassium-transporting ATPase subunit KdpA [Polyangiaceae bacterium]|jgi:K+-transporting ATPase ATPase A chain|nr:potassium-transporting ATPase subunit KdpA [Polyangiaceae bacterium]
MTPIAILQVVLYFGILLVITKPLGSYMARVFEGEKTFLHGPLGWLERGTYRVLGVDPHRDMKWTEYATSMLMFSLASMVFTYGALRLQGILPLNPQHFGVKQMPADLAFNTAASFTTNTNWQSYSPEVTMSYFSNMVALAIHNWASAAVGIAIAIAVIRGFSRKSADGIGNFWADMVRCTLYVLLPLSFVGAVVFLAMGVPQNFDPYTVVTTLEGGKQTIALGPVASQEIIKQLGTNGGGFFNANSAHPFENPTPLSNFFTLVLIWSIPGAITHTFGKMVGNTKQGWALFGAMAALALAGMIICTSAEQAGTPHLAAAHIQTAATAMQSGGNMEGKEVRFGIAASSLFATVTTGASCGAVNAMHDSFTPIGGLVPLFNMLTGEVIFGGVGAGLYGMLMFAVLAVFIAGLMVGRTPEYLGKKIEKFEVQMAMLATLVLAASVLGFAALSSTIDLPKTGALAALNTWPGSVYGGADAVYGAATGNLNNAGPHGFSEIFYAYASGTGNNGSAFAGITANTPWYNGTIALAALIGRFLMIVPLLAMAGALAKKVHIPASSGTFPTDTPTFAGLLVGVVVIVGALTYFPGLALGPIVEQFQMNVLATH